MPKYTKQIAALDLWLQRVSNGRTGIVKLAGIPDLVLHLPGRKTGIIRSTPLICSPHPDGLLIAGSNWGQAKLPAWVYNIRAVTEFEIDYAGDRLRVRPVEVTGEVRDQLWQDYLLKTWPTYQLYESRTSRYIPVFQLQPV